ncbi:MULTISPECIES: glutamate ABC transporter substrate-binding protein [Streptomyces]|uniref:Glutamate ABC transporter substrate-binding protein n=1 Tax=Streptomyces koelreuteriae TaxID=2838015 RepID=A0ABX8FWE8_9ACTN|nr:MULTISPECIES: glutamate ABC transporter substrate-binding protein [Streptomyces]QWB25523.1 glutamate ABC transporter substrate-binding protein [Streptomyces koelreuteriae]UUA08568.1 glutamate ABC transporter substrate-binding protein [Streptomyces koelreuteriae]UUA16173.1 glutamate ABC transporter substrate-binding protein [Streptomyces sp. CRCS-T-1]
MRARRLRAGLKGWGGVATMAVACALVAVFALCVPLSGRGLDDGRSVTQASQTTVEKAEEDCEAPEKQTLSPSSADGDTIQAIKDREGEKRKLIVGVDQNSYRWGYRNPNSGKTAELEGFDIDLVHRIADDILGDPDAVQFKAIPTDQRIPAIQDGRVDMVVRTMTINCDRIEDVAFSAPYFKTGQQVLAPKSSPVKGYDDTLADRKICTAAGSTAYSTLEADQKDGKLPATTDISTTVPNQLDCLVRLQLGEVDAVVTDGALAASQAAQDPTVQLKGDAFTAEYYGVAMKKDADDLVRRVNQILVDYREDTANGWQASYGKWLSATLGKDAKKSEPPAPQYLRNT